MGVDPFCSDADLTGVGKCRSIDFPGHLCDIDVVKHDAGVVSAEFERYPLESAGGAFENLLPRRGSACEISEEHTSELQSLMRISYAVLCLIIKTRYIIAMFLSHPLLQFIYYTHITHA